MADIYDSLKTDELSKLCISSYIAVVYDSSSDKFHYYLLERSINNNYMLCSIDENGTHHTHSPIENSKKTFIETVKSLTNNQQ